MNNAKDIIGMIIVAAVIGAVLLNYQGSVKVIGAISNAVSTNVATLQANPNGGYVSSIQNAA